VLKDASVSAPPPSLGRDSGTLLLSPSFETLAAGTVLSGLSSFLGWRSMPLDSFGQPGFFLPQCIPFFCGTFSYLPRSFSFFWSVTTGFFSRALSSTYPLLSQVFLISSADTGSNSAFSSPLPH